MADGDDEQQNEILQILKEEGLDDLFKNVTSPSYDTSKDQTFPAQLYDPTAGEIPEGILRSELERLLGLRPADDPDDPLAQGFDVEAVEAFAKSIEEGTGSLQPPPEFWDAEPEAGDQFLNRLNKSVENFEEMLLSKKEQAKLRRERKSAGEIEDPDDSEDAFRELIEDIPMFPEDYIKNIPAPTIPDKAVAQFERAERVLLVLRRALLENKFTPSAGIDALIDKDLISASSPGPFYFEDPWLVVDNLNDALEYLKKMELKAGIYLDIDTMFSSYYEYKPEVKCRIIVHTLMHAPLPSWYASYLQLHGQPAPPKDEGPRHRRQAGEAIKINLIKNEGDETQPLVPGVLFPREVRDVSSDEKEQQPNAKAFAKWLQRPSPIAAQRQVWIQNPTWESGDEEDLENQFEVIGKKKSSRKKKKKKNIISPDYSLLPPAAALVSKQESSGWYAEPTAKISSEPIPPLPRPAPLQPGDLDFDPITPDEAEQLLRELLGDKFDDIAAQLPQKAPSAIVPEDHFQELQIGATWSYEVDPQTGHVSSVYMQWNWVGGLIADVTHAYDIYLTECGMLK